MSQGLRTSAGLQPGDIKLDFTSTHEHKHEPLELQEIKLSSPRSKL